MASEPMDLDALRKAAELVESTVAVEGWSPRALRARQILRDIATHTAILALLDRCARAERTLALCVSEAERRAQHDAESEREALLAAPVAGRGERGLSDAECDAITRALGLHAIEADYAPKDIGGCPPVEPDRREWVQYARREALRAALPPAAPDREREAIPPVPAAWTPDCSGKQDYDGCLVTLSTRYWPRGGGFYVLTPERRLEGNEARPEIRPSAKATIFLGSTADEFYDCAEPLAVFEVEADSEDEVKAPTESWVQEQFARIARALRAEFVPDAPAQGEGVGDA